MNIEMRSLSSIRPYPNNPRLNDAAVDAVAASISEFGWRQPLVLDEEGVIVVGDTRFKAAQKLGLVEVPVHIATGLTRAQIRTYRIADNQLARLSEFDNDKLATELIELQSMNFDLNLTGFSPEELLGLMTPATPEGLTDPDEVPEPPDKAITQPGDLWVLGSHRLLCGDSSKCEDVDLLLDGQAIHLIVSDPPYNVRVEPRSNNAIAAGNSSFKKTHHQKFDLERHPRRPSPPPGKCVPRIGRSRTIS